MKFILNVFGTTFYGCRDGLHFTSLGNRVLFEEVVRKLKDMGLSLETMLVDQPLFYDIDPKDPLKTFCN